MKKEVSAMLLMLILVCGMFIQGCAITNEPKIMALRSQIDEVDKQIQVLSPRFDKAKRIMDENEKMEEQIDRLKVEISELKMKKNSGGK
ncbi:MAG: hypothetical protein AB2L14_35065 [Candidatus Xenobiia bacterium LiM19]